MKTNFTLLRQSILIAFLSLAFSKSFSENIITPNTDINLRANVVNNNLIVDWNLSADSTFSYCEVQASEDGKTFITIGYVMGAEPKVGSDHFVFKQQFNKIKAGKIYYRVLNVAVDGKASATYTVKLVQQ